MVRLQHIQSWIKGSPVYLHVLLCVFSALLCLAVAPPLHWKWVAWFALVPLFYSILRTPSVPGAFLLGGIWGLVYYGCMTAFLNVWSTTVYLSLLIICICSFAVMMGLTSALEQWFDRYLFRIFAPVFLWLLVIWIAGFTPLGATWLYIGDLQPGPLRGFLALGSSPAMMFMILLANRFIAGFFQHGERSFGRGTFLKMGGIVLLFVAIGPAYHYYLQFRTEHKNTEKRTIGLIQPELPYSISWRKKNPEYIMMRMRSLVSLVAKRSFLVVWPEYNLPGTIAQNRGFPYSSILDLAILYDTPILLGTWDGESDLQNVAVIAQTDGTWSERYATPHPPPFRKQKPGTSVIPMSHQGVSFGALLCYDDLEPELAGQLVHGGAQFFVSLSNDGLFFGTREPSLHVERTQVVAASLHRMTLRACPNGYSAFVKPDGEPVPVQANGQTTGIWPEKEMARTVQVPLLQVKTLYAYLGNWVSPLCGALLFLFIGFQLFWKKERISNENE